MLIVSPPDDWAARASARDNSNLNTKRKKLSRKQKDDICEQLTERMGRARDVYSTFRVELRCVLKELGKVCALTLFVPARRTGKPPAGNLLTFGPDFVPVPGCPSWSMQTGRRKGTNTTNGSKP